MRLPRPAAIIIAPTGVSDEFSESMPFPLFWSKEPDGPAPQKYRQVIGPVRLSRCPIYEILI
jgi:hypothetical protein